MPQFLIGQSEQYMANVPKQVHQAILSLLQLHMKPEQPRIDFDPTISIPEGSEKILRLPMRELEGVGTVRATLTDHGSVEALKKNSGLTVNTQYSVDLEMQTEA